MKFLLLDLEQICSRLDKCKLVLDNTGVWKNTAISERLNYKLVGTPNWKK
jgi:hypothetical protein